MSGTDGDPDRAPGRSVARLDLGRVPLVLMYHAVADINHDPNELAAPGSSPPRWPG